MSTFKYIEEWHDNTEATGAIDFNPSFEVAHQHRGVLLKALRFAAGMLSTTKSFTDQHPEAVLDYIMKVSEESK